MWNMRFVNSPDPSVGQGELLSKLSELLSKGKLLWIVSGGSNIPIEVNILNALEDSLTANLNILLSDERYGRSRHKDSNYQLLVEAGINIKQANFPNILDQDLSPEQTLRRYIQVYEEFSQASSSVIAQLGIGYDGHIAGVLPNSPATDSTDLIAYYESKPYNRLTLTLNTLKTVDKIDVFCFGINKHPVLDKLKAGQESSSFFPSMVLREITDVTVYNDHLEG